MKCYLSLGSNLGDRFQYLQFAQQKIEQFIGICTKKSSIYESLPWGKTDQACFLNQVLEVETKLLPLSVLENCLAIENQLGRQRIEKWGTRTIDIDVLLYEQAQIDLPTLKIPHPYLAQRRFVLEPFCEIAPNIMHPTLQQNMANLLQNCPDMLAVKLFS